MYIVIYNRMIRQQRSEKLTDVNNSSTLLKTLKVQGAKKTKRNETKGVAELWDLCELERSKKKRAKSWDQKLAGSNIRPVGHRPKLILWAISRANKS